MAAIALLHAFPLSPAMFDEQARALRAAGHEVVVPDLLTATAIGDAQPDLGVLAHHVRAVMSDAGHSTFAVAGLSMGGYVAMALLRLAAHHVSGLALLDTKATADSEVAAKGRLEYAERVAREGMDWVPSATIEALLGETTRATKPEVVAQVDRWILAADSVAVVWAQQAMAARPDSTADLAVFRRPAVVIVGQEDTLSPLPEALAMAAALGGVPVAEIPTSGHLSAVESPSAVSRALVAWADRISPGAP